MSSGAQGPHFRSTDMTDELDRHAGKAPDERHPVGEGAAPDPSDQADSRVAQPGDDPPTEDALGPDAPG